MAKTMSRSTLDEYLEKMRYRYRRHPGKPAKGLLLDEFCQVSGHERKYASKLLCRRRGLGSRGRCPPNVGGRPKSYDAEVVGILLEIWKHSEQPCGKRLVPMLKDWLPYYERRFGELLAATRKAVPSISAAQIDRVLGPMKCGCGVVNRRTPKANAAIKALAPIRAECWDARELVGWKRTLWRTVQGQDFYLPAHATSPSSSAWACFSLSDRFAIPCVPARRLPPREPYPRQSTRVVPFATENLMQPRTFNSLLIPPSGS
jgi:hypothetical protein